MIQQNNVRIGRLNSESFESSPRMHFIQPLRGSTRSYFCIQNKYFVMRIKNACIFRWTVVCSGTSVYRNTVLFIPAVAGATLALYLSFSMCMHVLCSLLTRILVIILYILWCKAVWYSLRVRLSLSLFPSFQGHAHPFRLTARQLADDAAKTQKRHGTRQGARKGGFSRRHAVQTIFVSEIYAFFLFRLLVGLVGCSGLRELGCTVYIVRSTRML